MYSRFGRCIIVKALKNDSLTKIVIPSNKKIESYKQAIINVYLLLSYVWSTMNGLKLYLQQSGNTKIQACFSNGWTHGHYVTSVFVFCPNGIIPIAFFNFPGSVHNRQVAYWGRIYKKLGTVYQETDEKCTVDSALGKVNHPFLIKSSQGYLVLSAPTCREQRLDIQRKQ